MPTNPYASPSAPVIDPDSRARLFLPLRLLRVAAVGLNVLLLLLMVFYLFSLREPSSGWQGLVVSVLCLLSLYTLLFAIRHRAVAWMTFALNGLLVMVLVGAYVAGGQKENANAIIGLLVVGVPAALNVIVIAVLRISHVRRSVA